MDVSQKAKQYPHRDKAYIFILSADELRFLNAISKLLDIRMIY